MKKRILFLMCILSHLLMATLVEAATPQSGWWWNPDEPGRGYFIEVTGDAFFVGSYLYDNSGSPLWYVTGPAKVTSSGISGTLGAYSGGQSLTGTYKTPTGPTPEGNISIDFSDASHGTITWPGGTVPIVRYEINPGAQSLNAAPNTFQPETGWWWNESEGGRGFSIEVQGNNMFVAGFMYDASGNPVWYVSAGQMSTPQVYHGAWMEYANGQTMGNPFKLASLKNPNVGAISLAFTSPTTATLSLPDGRQIPITRYRFSAPTPPDSVAIGSSWTTRVAGFGATNGYLQDITWGNKGYVAVGSDPQSNVLIYTSTDGVQWIKRDTGLRRFWLNTVAWSGTEYIAGGLETTEFKEGDAPRYGLELLVSSDGITWSKRPVTWDGLTLMGNASADDQIKSIASSGSSFVALRRGTIYSSPDSVTWTSRREGVGASRVVWNNGQYTITADYEILTSSDGINWTSKRPKATATPAATDADSFASLSLRDALWSGSMYVVLGQNGYYGAETWAEIMNSIDGISWTSGTWQSGFFSSLFRVAQRGPQFVATGSLTPSLGIDATVDAILTSSNGIDWKIAYLGDTFRNLKSVAASPIGYAAVGADGAIITSP